MMGYVAALAYGALTLAALLVLSALLGNPLIALLVVLAAGSAYLCQTAQLLWPDSWIAAAVFWGASVLFTVAAVAAAAGGSI